MDPRIEIFMLKLVYIQNFTLVKNFTLFEYCVFLYRFDWNLLYFCLQPQPVVTSSIEFIFNLHIQVK